MFRSFVGLAALLFVLPAGANDGGLDAAAVADFVREMVREHDFDETELDTVFRDAVRSDRILAAMSRPAEKAKPWYEYRKHFLTEARISGGIEFWRLNAEWLDEAARVYGVPAEIIVAIIGVETYYGRVAGSYRVIDALSTLAFDYPARSPFFTSELKHYLILARDQGLDPTELKGSYAGAMGFGQFMPSSYREYARDFDGDGIVDIWENPVDAIGSVANYFKQHGWRTGETVVAAADASDDTPEDVFVQSRKDLKPEHTVAEFAAQGVVAREKLDPEALATAMKFELEDGYEYWLGLHNFYVITRYNHSAMYAMSVYQLSQRLGARVE